MGGLRGCGKDAFVSNLFTADVQPGPTTHRTGEVRWGDRRSTVPLISAAAAVERMRAAAEGKPRRLRPASPDRPPAGHHDDRDQSWFRTGPRVDLCHHRLGGPGGSPAIATTAMVSVAPDTSLPRMAIDSRPLWADGRTLTVSFR